MSIQIIIKTIIIKLFKKGLTFIAFYDTIVS